MNKEMKGEALRRMRDLGMFDGAIGDFEREDVVYISKNGGFIYGLSKEDWPEEEKELKDNFEKETGNLIYHMIHSKMAGFDMVSALIVSKYMEQYDKNNGYVFTYTFNLDEPQFSEFGTIGVECRYGGLVRIF